MSKHLVIYEKNRFNFFIIYKRFKEVILENNYKNNERNENFKKINQFYDAKKIKESDYNISNKVELIYRSIINEKFSKIDDEDLKNSSNTLKQKIALYVCDIQRSFTFAKIIKEKYKIKGKIFIETSLFNYKIYKTMKNLGLLEKNIDIVLEVKIINYIFYLLKNLYFLFKILLYPEINIFKNTLFGKDIKKRKKKLISIFVKDIKFNKKNLNITFLENKKFKSKIIYLSENKNTNSQIDNKNRKIINFNDNLFKNFSFFYYIKNFYLFLFIKRNRFLKFGLKYPIFFNVMYQTIKNITYWKLFYTLYDTKFHLVAMSDEKIFIKNLHYRNNVKTIFLYFSSTEELIKNKSKRNFSRVNYVYLNYDFFVSDKVSIDLFKLQKTKVKKFIKIGNLGSKIILENKNNFLKKRNKKKIGITNKKTIITFFDHSIGRDGVWNQVELGLFLEKIFLLLKNFNFEIIYKSKKEKLEIFHNFSEKNKLLFNQILKFKNFSYLDGENKKLSAYELIAMSDLVISAPVSSIISETLSASKKLLVYDPHGKYKSSQFFINKISELYCNDEKKFITKLKILENMSEKRYKKMIFSKFISSRLKLKNFGANLNNLKKILYREL